MSGCSERVVGGWEAAKKGVEKKDVDLCYKNFTLKMFP